MKKGERTEGEFSLKTAYYNMNIHDVQSQQNNLSAASASRIRNRLGINHIILRRFRLQPG